MRILLTGGTGFIGSAVLKMAAGNGHAVAALVRPGKVPVARATTNVRLFRGSLADAPWDELAAFKAEVCIHTAWITTPGIYLDSSENNQFVEWSATFIKQAVARGVRRVVALGTCLEYQMTGGVLSEAGTPLAPVSPYAHCKDALRRRLEACACAEGFSFNWGRVFYPYGPGEHPARLASSAIRQLRAGAPLPLQNADSVKDYIFIDDLAAAILTLAASAATGTTNLGTGTGVTVGEVARTLAGLLGRPELVRETKHAVPDPLAFVVADVRRLNALGWRPRVSLRAGLQQLVQQEPP